MRLAKSSDSGVRSAFAHTASEENRPRDPRPLFLERAFHSYGVPFRIRTPSVELLAALPSIVPHQTKLLERVGKQAEVFTLLPRCGEQGFRCFRGSDLICEALDAQSMLEQLGSELMVHVANLAPDRVFVHAGVVGWRGRALLLPGASFAGKTTLIAALVRAGATYYSDEYAVVDDCGRVHPYTRPLQVREPGGTVQRAMAVEALAGVAGTEPLAAAQVAFAQFRPDARWNPAPLSSGRAVLEMLRHTIPVQRTPARVMATLSALMQGASAWSGERGEADATAATLLAALDASLGITHS